MKDLSNFSIADLKVIIDHCKSEIRFHHNDNIEIEEDIKVTKKSSNHNYREVSFLREQHSLNIDIIETYDKILAKTQTELDERVLLLEDVDGTISKKITIRRIVKELIQEHQQNKINKVKTNKQNDFKKLADKHGFKSATSISNEYYRQIRIGQKKKN